MKWMVIQTRAEYEEMMEAIEQKRACQLMECYHCPSHPLRGVVRTRVIRGIQDPTETYTLSCGHTIL